METNEPPGRVQHWSNGIIGPILVEVHLMMVRAKYLSTRLCGFWEEDFLKFLLYTYKAEQWPRAGLPGG